MSNNNPNQPGWRFDPQTGQPINPDPQPQPPSQPPPQPPQPQPQSGWSFDPQTGQPVQPPAPQPEQPSYPQPQQPGYTQPMPNQPYTPTPPGGYRAQPEQPGYPPQYGPPQQPQPYQQYPQYQQPPTGPMPTTPYTPQQTNVSPEKKRGGRGLLIGGLLVLVLLIAGGVAAFLILNRAINPPAAGVDRVLPINALAYFTVDPVLDGTQKAAMDQLGEAFKSQPGFDDAWAKITEQTAEMAGGGNTAENCAPGMADADFGSMSSYLGNNLTIAMLPPSTSDLEGLQNGDVDPGTVLGRNVVGMVDLDFNPLNKQGPAAELKTVTDNVGTAELVEKYREMDIRKATICDGTVYFTLLDGSATAVLAAQVEPLKVVMDEYKDNKGLKTDTRFAALQAQVPAARIATLYLNLTEIYKQASLIDPQATEAVQGVEGAMLITLSAENDGLRFDVASEADFSNNLLGMSTDVQLNPNAKPDVNTIADIPTGSLGFVLGTDLQSIIQGVIDAVHESGGDAAASMDDTIIQIEDATGLDMGQDILPLLAGDWAVSVSSDPGAPFPVGGLVFQLKLKQGDQEKAQQLIEGLANQASGGETQIMDVGGNNFYTLSPDGTTLAGTVGDRLVFAVSFNGEPADQSTADVVDNFGNGIGSTDAWRETAKHLPQNSNIIGWVDFNAIRELAEGSMEGDGQEEYETTAAPFVRPFKYLLVGSSSQAPEGARLSRNHTIFFLGIGK